MARDGCAAQSGSVEAVTLPLGMLTLTSRRAGLAALLAAAPLATASATTAERVFAAVFPSVVVVEGTAQGSGVVVAPRLVATNYHVLGEAPQVVVRRGQIGHAATPARVDLARDVCLLGVPTLDAPAVALGTAAPLRVGATVFAVGAPAGLELSLSAGIVSRLRAAEGAPMVQTTAPVSPRSSGGGLFDERGRLVGLTTFQVGRGQNLNFALPAEWVAAALAGHAAWQRCRAALDAPCLMAEALARAHGIADADWRAAALRAVARAQAQAGEVSVALTTARGIADARSRDRALGDIAEAQAEAGSIPGALATAREIGDVSSRASALGAVAIAQARTADITGGLATAGGIADASWRDSALARIAAVQARVGNVPSALATAHRIADASWRASGLADIAHAQAQAGDRQGSTETFAQALATARRIADADSRASALAFIAEAHSHAGDRQGAIRSFADALATVRGIDFAWERAEAFCSVAEAQANTGDRQEATRTIADAFASAHGIADASSCAQALGAVAMAEARTDDIGGALETIETIRQPHQRAAYLASLARHLATGR